jgi:hypothetical protein
VRSPGCKGWAGIEWELTARKHKRATERFASAADPTQAKPSLNRPPAIRGVPSEVVLHAEDGMKSPCAVNLDNAVTVSQQR